MSWLHGILEFPRVYSAVIAVLAGDWRKRYVAEYVKPRPGERVLDLGCGPGDVLRHLPGVDYVGVDNNLRYIEKARARFGSLGQFHCIDLVDCELRPFGTFDVVMANGVLHHLPDAVLHTMLPKVAAVMKPTGRFVTFDGCFTPEQSAVARFILRCDRGRFVRTRPAYEALMKTSFPGLACHLCTDFLRFPYTHLIMVASTTAAQVRPVAGAA